MSGAALKTTAAPSPSSGLNGAEKLAVIDGLNVELRPATLKQRFLAFCVDAGVVFAFVYAILIVTALALVVVGIRASLFSKLRESGSVDETLGWILIGVFVLMGLAIGGIYHGYFDYYEFKRGDTPGKRLFGLKVVPTRASRLSLGQVLLRDAIRYIDVMMLFPGPITMLLTKRKQRIGDLMAGTLVVHSQQREDRPNYLYLREEDYHYLRESLAPKPVTSDVRSHYLKFAAPAFLMPEFTPMQLTPALFTQWEEYVRSYFQAPSAEVDQKLALRFFAELCFQTERAERKR